MCRDGRFRREVTGPSGMTVSRVSTLTALKNGLLTLGAATESSLRSHWDRLMPDIVYARVIDQAWEVNP